MRVLLLVCLIACEREERTFSAPAPSSRPADLTPNLSLYAGAKPIEGTALDPALPGYAETAQAVSEGKQLYAQFNCIGCHVHGGGNIGPALIDSTWTYGSKPIDIATSIIAGRPMGMPAYRGKIAPAQLYQIVAYVRALGGMVRGDAVPARDEHLQAAPALTLQHEAVPLPGTEHPR
jgi:cytochrome c oxidase cbb3-type subunit 3